MRVLVTGGNGDLGRRLVPRLLAAGDEVVVGTRHPGPRHDGATEVRYAFDDREALDVALAGVDTVVHAATSPLQRDGDVDAARALVAAAARAGVGHIVYVSIVGIDGVPYPYYQVKARAEREIAGGEVAWTILRTTQFHSLISRYGERMAKGPLVIAPARVPLQPVDGDAVADRVTELVGAGPSGRVADMGGPDVIDLASAVRAHLRATGRHRPVLTVPMWGATAGAFRSGATHAAGDPGGVSFDDYLRTVTPRRPDRTSALLRVIAVCVVLVAAAMAFVPQGFVTAVAGIGVVADHYVRDLATFAAPLGIALWLAASRRSWRRPVLALALVQNGLHLLNHLVDITTAVPSWHGPANVVALAVLQVLLVVAWRAERPEQGSPTAADGDGRRRAGGRAALAGRGEG